MGFSRSCPISSQTTIHIQRTFLELYQSSHRCNEIQPHNIHDLAELDFGISSVYHILYGENVCEMDNDNKHLEILRMVV